MTAFHDRTLGELGTVAELQTFLIDHGFVISLGDGVNDEFAVTAKGRDLWLFFELCRRAGDGAWDA